MAESRMPRISVAVLALGLLSAGLAAQRMDADLPLEVFVRAASGSRDESERALETLAANWRHGYAALLLDLAELKSFSQQPASGSRRIRRAPHTGSTSAPIA